MNIYECHHVPRHPVPFIYIYAVLPLHDYSPSYALLPPSLTLIRKHNGTINVPLFLLAGLLLKTWSPLAASGSAGSETSRVGVGELRSIQREIFHLLVWYPSEKSTRPNHARMGLNPELQLQSGFIQSRPLHSMPVNSRLSSQPHRN